MRNKKRALLVVQAMMNLFFSCSKPFSQEDASMRSKPSWIRLGGLCVVVVGICALWVGGRQLAGEEAKEAQVKKKANVFFYPQKLTPKDKLTDGREGKEIEIKSETAFIWVDLAPEAKFAHLTEYILVSPEKTRVIKGAWWPAL
jgi:hypothetical protein